MKLSEISVERPVFATMMSLALVLFGLVALQRLPVRELPDIDPPIVNILTVYPGANAQVVETEVTEKIEEAVMSVEGIKTLTSQSREQASNVTIEFDLRRPIDVVAQDVRDRVARIRGMLPEGIDEPVVTKQEADAQPIMWIALFSEKYSTLELTSIAENLMKDRLQTVNGVSSVVLGGSKRFAIRLRLDAGKMAAHQVTVLDVENALRTQNVELPSGRIENLEREMTIQTLGEMKTTEEFNQLVIRRDGDAFVRLQDVGVAEVGVEDERAIARYNSEPAVGLGIVRQSKANTIEVADGVKAALEELLPTLPAGVKTFIPYDESIFVEESIHEVWVTLGIAFILVVITIFVFLRNVRSTLVPCFTIPVSIIGTFMILSLFGYSVNILTMLALVLAIGIVVDDSIIVLENIYRHIERGMAPMEATIKGMREIAFAVIATTLSLCAVFIPLAFQTTITGRLFIEFAIALSGSVLISSFVALSLTPAVSARILKPAAEVKHGSLFNLFERGFTRFQAKYERTLTWALDHRAAIAILSVLLFIGTYFALVALPKEFLPEEDKGRLLAFAITPEGSTSEYTDRMVRRMEEVAKDTPEVLGYFTAVALPFAGPGKANEGIMFMRLAEERERSVRDLLDGPNGMAARMIGGIEGSFSIPIVPKAVSRGFGQPFQLVIQEQDLEKLNATAREVVNKLQTSGYLVGVRSNFELNKPELRIRIDRNRAAALGVSVEDISRTLQILFGGLDLSKVKLGGKEYDVIGQLARESRLTPSDVNRLFVRSARGELVQLSNVVSLETGAGPSEINRFNRFRSATIEGTPMGVPLGTAMDNVKAMLASEFPGVRYTWTGESDDLLVSGRGFIFVLVLAVIVIYMVLASQFESLKHPLTIMLTIPLAAAGAIGLLWLLAGVNVLGTMFHGWSTYAPNPPDFARWMSEIFPRIPAMNMNLFSQIGIVLLLGMATKNAILLVEFANQRVKEGMSARDAMMQAGLIRFRPILMTSFSTILGILPIALGLGAGGESRRPMGVAAIGGLLTSTFLTLLVVPVAYVLFAGRGARAKAPRRAAGAVVTGLVALLALALPSTVRAQEEKASGQYDLRRCIETAIENNYDIRKARENVTRAGGAIIEARASVVPNLQANGNFTRSGEDLANNFGGGPGFEAGQDSWRVGIDLVQSLYRGGANRATITQQKELEQAAVLALQTAINDVLLNVRRSYYQVLLARSQIEVQEQNMKLLEEELTSAQHKLDAGVVSPFNVLRAEVAVANGKTPLIRARNQYRVAMEELTEVLGIGSASTSDQPAIDVVGELAFEEYEPDLALELQRAMDNRPELKQLARVTEAQRQGLQAARAGRRPDVSAFAGYGWENDKLSDDTWDEVDGWRVGVQFGWNVFDGAATRGRLIQQGSALKLAELDEAQARQRIDVEVRRAHASVVDARELVNATQQVVKQAEESVRLARSRFDVGAATQLDVLDAQVSLTEARDNQVQALHDYTLALAALKRAMGTLDQVFTVTLPAGEETK